MTQRNLRAHGPLRWDAAAMLQGGDAMTVTESVNAVLTEWQAAYR